MAQGFETGAAEGQNQEVAAPEPIAQGPVEGRRIQPGPARPRFGQVQPGAVAAGERMSHDVALAHDDQPRLGPFARQPLQRLDGPAGTAPRHQADGIVDEAETLHGQALFGEPGDQFLGQRRGLVVGVARPDQHQVVGRFQAVPVARFEKTGGAGAGSDRGADVQPPGRQPAPGAQPPQRVGRVPAAEQGAGQAQGEPVGQAGGIGAALDQRPVATVAPDQPEQQRQNRKPGQPAANEVQPPPEDHVAGKREQVGRRLIDDGNLTGLFRRWSDLARGFGNRGDGLC